MAALRGLRQLLCAVSVMALVACSGIGNGDKVEYLKMTTKSGTAITDVSTQPYILGYQCLRQQLGIIAVFGHNGSADYTVRPGTTWTSSDPEVVQVSNGDQLDPTDPSRVFPKGVITPLRAGSSIITADYVGVKTSIQVVVREPESIILSTSQYDTASDASAAGPLSIATGSTQQYHAYAKLRDANDVVFYQDVTGNADWSSTNDANGSHVSVTNPAAGLATGGGLVKGLSPGGPFVINANFTACPGTQYENITAQVEVSELASLNVTHDPNFLALANPPPPLVVDTSEAFVATGLLANGNTQDLSYQASFDTNTGNANIISFAGNVGTAIDKGTAQVTASFGSITSPALTVQTQTATLNNYQISPGIPPTAGAPNDRDQYINYQGYHAFHALGTFVPDVPAGVTPVPFPQDLTQNSVWVSSSNDDVSIGTGGELAGIAVSRRAVQTCVNITGIFSTSAFDVTALGVGAPTSNSTCP